MTSRTADIDSALVLIRELAGAIDDGRTRSVLARRLADAFGQSLPVLRLELGACDAELATAQTTVVTTAPGQPVTVAQRSLPGTAIESSVRRYDAHVATTDRPDTAPDEREALEAGAARVVYLPLVDLNSREQAYVTLWLGIPNRDELPLDSSLLHATTRMLLVGHRSCDLIRRLATLSRSAHRESHDLRRRLDRLVGARTIVAQSEVMRRALEKIQLVAAYDTTVLLRGESGTGKELFARHLHHLSTRRDGPFVSINCGALPDGLVESELFGHEKGAFTGAGRSHRGRFERAHHGTLLLDEVAELPAAAQVKLLRVLQEGEIERLGAERTRRVDVRVVAATHQPLEQLVESGQFRQDLYYRLNVFPVVIPPLRERPDDVAPLAQALLDEIAARLGREAPAMSRGTLTRLQAHPWRGNVRELANVLESAMILSTGPTLRLTELPSLDLDGEAKPPAPTAIRPLDDTIRDAIERAVAASGSRIYGAAGAAERLGLKPSTLQSKMRKLGIKTKKP